MADNFRDVVSAPLGKVTAFAVFAEVVRIGKARSVLRVTQIVEVYAVHIVVVHDLADKAHQVFFGLRMSGIEEVFPFVRHTDGGLLLGDGFFAQRGDMFAVAQRDSHHPSVAFHSTLVAFFYGKSQRVIARISPCLTGQDGIEGFYF